MSVTVRSKTIVKDKGYRHIIEELNSISSAEAEVGIFDDKKVDGEYIAVRGTTTEFGTKTAPAWHWMSKAIDENVNSTYFSMQAKLLNRIFEGQETIDGLVFKIATQIEADMVERIIFLRSPANKLATILAKGSSNPLVENGDMHKSIDQRTKIKRKPGIGFKLFKGGSQSHTAN